MINRCVIAVGLVLTAAPAFAQGMPPMMLPNGTMIPGTRGYVPGSHGLDAANRDVRDVIGGYHSYHDRQTGYGSMADNFHQQWVGPGGQRAQTWYNVPPPGYWRPMYR